ncbi:type II toxin-antitoxin system RelE/ParE family toxin [Candidatus Babeliales bacterium]|nr:type II toxin-antitoxin system RelE/ParE family toxin [Candidatus Babeliales bacterium]
MKKNKQVIAYEGQTFTIEWYTNDVGRSEALDYYEKLDIDRQLQLMKLLIWMGDLGSIRNKEKFRHEGSGIYVFKPQPDRFFCFFFKGGKIIITNGYEKKSDKMSKKDFDKAMRMQQDYEERYKKETYYEKNS